MLRFCAIFLLLVGLHCVHSEHSSLEANVTAKMKHLMEEFSKDGNKHPMSDVLVFVHSNYDAPMAQVKMYYQMMHGVFPRMIFFGEWSHEKVHELHQHGLPVFKCPHNSHGTLAQVIMLKALESFQHPYFKGYMYIHDDLLLSPKTIIDLDKSKLWISSGMERTVLEPWSSRGFRWVHFNQGGIDSMQRIYNEYPEIESIVDKCTDSKATGVPVKGTSHTLYNGHSDFFYLPVSLIPTYKKYMSIFVDKGVFLEIAVAMWAKCFTPNFDTEAIELLICTTWDYSVRSDIWKWGPNCPVNTSIIHPVKYSDRNALKFAQEFLIKHKTKYSNTNFTMHRR